MDITTETQQGQDIISNISFNRFKTLVNAKSLKKLEPIFEVGNPNERTTSSSDPKVVRDDIIKVQFEEYATYTFKIIAEAEENEFYNLVLYVNDQKEVVNSHVLKYIPSAKWLADPSQYFSGNVSIVNNTFFDENSFTDMLRGGDNCTETVNPVWVCEKGLAHYPGHPDCWQATWWKFYLEVETGSCGGAGSDSDNGNFDPLAGNPGNTGGPGGNGGNPNPGDPTGNNNITSSPNVVGDIDVHMATAQVVAQYLDIDVGDFEYGWLINYDNKDEVKEIAGYLNGNNAQSILFGQKAIEELLSGSEVDFENEIIKDPTFVGTKADCVFELLKTTNNDLFKDVMSAFTNDNAKLKLNFKIGSVPQSAEGSTTYDFNSGVITITFPPAINAKSSLEIASMILHESIHAELRRIYHGNNQVPEPLPSSQFNYLVSLWEYYSQGGSSPNSVSNNASHTFMVHNHVLPIANAIRQLDNNTHPIDNYMWFGWDGLSAIGKITQPPLLTSTQEANYINLQQITFNDNVKQSCDE